MRQPFPFTRLVSAYDKDLTPVIQRGISRYITETTRARHPNIPEDVLLQLHKERFQEEYYALALLISKELIEHAKTLTPNPSGGSTTSG